MAVIFLEGFDSYGATFDEWFKWNGPNSSVLATGRFGTGKSLVNGAHKFLGDFYSSLTVGFGLNMPGGGFNLMRWFSGPNFIMDIGVNATNSLLYINGLSTSIYSTKPIPYVTWVYFEVHVADFSSTLAGNLTVRLNGEQILSSPSGFNINAGSGTASGFWLYSAGGANIYYDDLYVTNDVGPYNTSFIEDGDIITLFPNGAGASTQFDLFGAATNWQAVSEAPNDGDTSYVFSGTNGDKDLYTVPTITIGNTFVIPAIAINTVARRDATDNIGFQAVIKSGVNEGNSATADLGNSYSTFQGIFEREPVTNNPWNETLVNAMQIGSEVVV